jgi:hypothetical protein
MTALGASGWSGCRVGRAPTGKRRLSRRTPGTAIAMFDENGRYNGHAAIYLDQDKHGVQVVDQWNRRDSQGHITRQHQPGERTLPLGDPRHAPIDRGEFYYVVQ